jgi:hypothetical protein
LLVVVAGLGGAPAFGNKYFAQVKSAGRAFHRWTFSGNQFIPFPMPELPVDFDLKLMPDWLKEPASKNPYADYQGGGDDDRRSRGGGDFGRGRDDRRGRPGGQRPGGGDNRGPKRDDRGGPRRDAPGGRKPDGKRPDRPAGRPDDRRGKPGDRPRGDDQRPHAAHAPHAPQGAPVQPANVTIEFFPDESCAVSIAKQIKSTHRAYSLFDLARMFLARPERHRLKITTKSVAEPLYQVGEDGPVSLDKGAAERAAFPMARHKYYEDFVQQREAPKGNFSNVARCRANGILLGPTNYHGYQPALRKMFEERFSRRMSFADFLREIDVVSDPALVEQWKQQSSSSTVYRLKKEKPAEAKTEAAPAAAEPPAEAAAPETGVEETPVKETAPVEAAAPEQPAEAQEPLAADPAAESPESQPDEAPAAPAPAYDGPVFASIQEVEQHFRENYLQGMIRSGSSFHLSGDASRAIQDRGIASSVRHAWEQERGFPGQMMHQLRQQFSRSGLHVFKHRKRMQFVSLIRPSPMEHGSLSPSVAEILHVVQSNQNCTRTSLAAAILGTDDAAVDQARKSTLATDLRWLIETGRVIEFSDGRLELPIVPAPAPAKPESPATKTADAPQEEKTAPVPATTAPEQSTPTAQSEQPAAPESAKPDPDKSDGEPSLPNDAILDIEPEAVDLAIEDPEELAKTEEPEAPATPAKPAGEPPAATSPE